MSDIPPGGARVTRDFETLRIAFPADKLLVRPASPRPEDAGPPLERAKLVFLCLMILLSVSMILTMEVPMGWELILLNLFELAVVVFIAWKLVQEQRIVRDTQPLYRSLPAVAIELRPHSLQIRTPKGEQDIAIEDISQVTTDQAGARIRVRDRMVYLLPERTDEERVWLAAILSEAIANRQSRTDDDTHERARLESLLQRT